MGPILVVYQFTIVSLGMQWLCDVYELSPRPRSREAILHLTAESDILVRLSTSNTLIPLYMLNRP